MLRIIIFISLILGTFQLSAIDVKGKIVDSEGSPIVDAYILKADGSFHASSNESC